MNKYKNVYFVGVKGVGMAALAVYLKERGIRVSGSDTQDYFHTEEELKKAGVTIKSGFNADHVPPDTDLVIVTGAHGGMNNVEAQKALNLGIKTMLHGQALATFMNKKTGISVTGSHGKTTTASMIAVMLKENGFDPSYAIGCASITGFGAAGHFGKGDYFVAEGDEYITDPKNDKTPRFLWQNPKIIVINNIEFDHPDAYKSIDDLRSAFNKFVQKLPNDGLLVAGIDDRQTQRLLKELAYEVPITTYGFSPQADYRIENFRISNQRTYFSLSFKGLSLGEFILHIPGRHNVLNASASFVVGNFLGLSPDKIKRGLASFTGTKRRFESIYEGRISLYDDYAHHPTEIQATLSSARLWFPDRRLVVIFQPHTYSRTKSLLADFARAFTGENIIVAVSDIYPSARESEDKSINSAILVNAIKRYHPSAYYLPTKSDVLEFLSRNLREGDIVFTMGAGDIFLWHKDIQTLLKQYG